MQTDPTASGGGGGWGVAFPIVMHNRERVSIVLIGVGTLYEFYCSVNAY